MIQFFADFNDHEEQDSRFKGGIVPLSKVGLLKDTSTQKVQLHEGMHILVFDDGCESEAVVEKHRGHWWARIVGTIRQVPEEEARRRLDQLDSQNNECEDW